MGVASGVGGSALGGDVRGAVDSIPTVIEGAAANFVAPRSPPEQALAVATRRMRLRIQDRFSILRANRT
jgi:hypothetical protein